MLKIFYLTLGQRVKQMCLRPGQFIAQVARLRRQRIVSDELEAERLDRIRNPAKYRGK